MTLNVNDGVVPAIVHRTRYSSPRPAKLLRSLLTAVFCANADPTVRADPAEVRVSTITSSVGVVPDAAVTSRNSSSALNASLESQPESELVVRAADATGVRVSPST